MNAGNLAEFGMTWLWRMSWQSAILVLLVLAAQWLFRDKLTPRWRFNLWWLVLIRLIIPVFPESPLSVFNLAHISFKTQIYPPFLNRPVAYVVPVSHIASTIPNAVLDQNNQAPAFLNRDHPILEQTREQASVSAIQQVVAKRFPIFSVLAWIWIAGVLFHGGRLCMGSWMLSRKIRDAFSSLDEDVAQIFESCRTTMRVARSPEIVVTSAVQSPALFGFMRIKLLIPSGMAGAFSPGEWRHIFMHELAHIRRRDVGLNWLMAVLHMLHWFNPIVWYAFKRMHSDRELACDAMVLSHAQNGEAKAYGRTIIKLLEGLSRPVAVAGLVGILESKNQIKQRIHMIAQFKPAQRKPFLAGLLLAMLSIAGMTDAQTSDSAKTNSTEEKGLTKTEPAKTELQSQKATAAQMANSNQRGIETDNRTIQEKLEDHIMAQYTSCWSGIPFGVYHAKFSELSQFGSLEKFQEKANEAKSETTIFKNITAADYCLERFNDHNQAQEAMATLYLAGIENVVIRHPAKTAYKNEDRWEIFELMVPEDCKTAAATALHDTKIFKLIDHSPESPASRVYSALTAVGIRSTVSSMLKPNKDNTKVSFCAVYALSADKETARVIAQGIKSHIEENSRAVIKAHFDIELVHLRSAADYCIAQYEDPNQAQEGLAVLELSGIKDIMLKPSETATFEGSKKMYSLMIPHERKEAANNALHNTQVIQLTSYEDPRVEMQASSVLKGKGIRSATRMLANSGQDNSSSRLYTLYILRADEDAAHEILNSFKYIPENNF